MKSNFKITCQLRLFQSTAKKNVFQVQPRYYAIPIILSQSEGDIMNASIFP